MHSIDVSLAATVFHLLCGQVLDFIDIEGYVFIEKLELADTLVPLIEQ